MNEKEIKELDEQAARELEEKDPSYKAHREEENKKKIAEKADVFIDTSHSETLAAKLALAEKERDDVKEKLKQIAQKEIERKLDSFSITDEEKRKFYHTHPDQFAQDYPSKAGSAPLNRNQMGQEERMKFSSYEEIIRYCRAHPDEIVTSNGLTGKDALRVMWDKTVQTIKSGSEIKGFSPDGEAPTRESRGPVEVALGPNMKNPQNSQLQEFLERANEAAREKIRIARDRAVVINQKRHEAD